MVPRIVNVVPRLVLHKAAPAAKHCSGVAFAMPPNVKVNPIGAPIPVIATAVESSMLALSD